MIYHVSVVELSPLQLVLVGTILEATVFIFEVPTGVVADVKSRRLSIIIGYALMGLGFIVEGSTPLFWAVAVAQVLWGFGYTFTSGATQAWIVDEIGEARAGEAFLRGAQAAQIGGLLAIPISVALGSVAIALPILLGGGLMVLLAVFLALTMTEGGFTPTPPEDRTTWGMMVKTVWDARQMVRRQPVLLALLGVGLFFGLYSEGLDRLWTPHLLENFTLPSWLEGMDAVMWFGVIEGVSAVVSLIATEVVRRRVDTSRSASLGQALMWNAGGIVLALAGFGLTRSFWAAVVLYWAVGVMRSVRWPLDSTWFNQRIDDPQVRATMFSVRGQVDAVGQITSGPVVGVIGNASIRAALVASAAILTPVLPLYWITIWRVGHVGKEFVQLPFARDTPDGNDMFEAGHPGTGSRGMGDQSS
jgi:DHA3 family tetracycline resistance protein-like MFS transporter